MVLVTKKNDSKLIESLYTKRNRLERKFILLINKRKTLKFESNIKFCERLLLSVDDQLNEIENKIFLQSN
jgi:hypothetical protein